MDKLNINFTLNGKAVSLNLPADKPLVNVLREVLKLTGTKEGCGVGDCGACTVIMDGEAVNSCLILAGQLEGRKILTIEGLSDSELHPIQQAFVEEGAIQCGYCSPGAIMSAKAFLDKTPIPSRVEIKNAISGNLCRCTGYQKIINAVERAAHLLNENNRNS